jgi:hypothetical protein
LSILLEVEKRLEALEEGRIERCLRPGEMDISQYSPAAAVSEGSGSAHSKAARSALSVKTRRSPPPNIRTTRTPSTRLK